MKKRTWRRIHALLLVVSMMIGMLHFEYRAEARETGEGMSRSVKPAVPQNVREQNGFIRWDAVAGAYGYTIQASKGGDTWEYRWYENSIEWKRFIYEHCYGRDFGNYAFKICAFDETGESTEFSSPIIVSYNATFSKPKNVSDVSDGQMSLLHLKWDEVEDAARYNIKIYRNDESHSLYTETYCDYNELYYSFWEDAGEYEYLVTVQAMDVNYHVSEWTEEVLVKVVIGERLATPQNVRFDESGKNIIWDEVKDADYYHVWIGSSSVYCEQPILENWKRYISPWSTGDNGEQYINVSAYNNNSSSHSSGYFEFKYTPVCDESIAVPQIRLEDGYVKWNKTERAIRYLYRIMVNGKVIDGFVHESQDGGVFWIGQYPEGDYEFELCVIDEEGSYNSKIYPLTLETSHDAGVWSPILFLRFKTLLWDYDRLRKPDTGCFWVRIRKKQGDVIGSVVKLEQQYSGEYYGLMDLEDGEYIVDVCVGQNTTDGHKLGPWSSKPLKIEKRGDAIFEEGNLVTTAVETAPEAVNIPEEDRILSIAINPATNMKSKNGGDDEELDLSKITVKAREIYDEEGLKKAEEALGEVLDGNKHYNLLDLTLLYDGEDFSNGYEGLVKVIFPLPTGHRNKIFSCYRITETGDKELIPGEQTEDSYIIYLEHFSVYALVATEPEETETPKGPEGSEKPHTHIYSSDWKSDATGHWKECACKDKAEVSAHTQDAGTVTKAATGTETGIRTYKCSVCGYVIKTEEIAKLPTGEETVSKKLTVASKLTKAQKKKNKDIINKKVSSKISGNSLTVTWNKLPGADEYDIYAVPCGDDFNKTTLSVGKNKTSANIRKINGRKINNKKTYKVKVKAYCLMANGKKQYIGVSSVMHVVGNMNKTTTNAKSISLKEKTFTLKKGGSAQIHATIIKADKKKKLLSQKHGVNLSYVSSDKAIATVTATGKIKAKKRGKCTIYVRALNGVCKEIKVTVN